MHILVGFLIGVAVMTGFYEPREMDQGIYHVDTLASAPLGGGRHTLPSLAEQKFANVVRQAYDYSCGSAALTTLMNHYLGESLTEMHVINGLLRYGDIQRISETRAFSLLDMKSLVEALGYEAHGYRTDADDLRKLEIPYIVSIDLYGYLHFVVIKGVFQEHIIIADPSMGNLTMPLAKFRDIWYKNVIFVVLPKSARNAYRQPGGQRDIAAARQAALSGAPRSRGNGHGNAAASGYGNGHGNADRVQPAAAPLPIPSTPEELNALGLGLPLPPSLIAMGYGRPDNFSGRGNGHGNANMRGQGNGYGNANNDASWDEQAVGGWGDAYGNADWGNGHGNANAAMPWGNGHGNAGGGNASEGDGEPWGNGHGNAAAAASGYGNGHGNASGWGNGDGNVAAGWGNGSGNASWGNGHGNVDAGWGNGHGSAGFGNGHGNVDPEGWG
ncbi:MAG: cysteine peptidase family C39 domain-containing protein, partial [Desulfatibacillaceae bacterium]|nr:cysteine peptidase family C39 domain-containing protein [Desulfatibacillaceae bacterium]